MTGGPILWTLTVWTLAALASVAALYYLAVIVACTRFRSRPRPEPPPSLPPVSILKPVHGLDSRFEANLRAHFEQDHPRFEILIGAADADDPAVEAAQRIAKGYPNRRLTTVICGESGAGNRKVAILQQLAPHAKHALLLVDDADIRPPQDWLAQTVAALETPGAGLATCLYRARPGATLGSKIERSGSRWTFPAKPSPAPELAGVSFALGATMLFRREDLDAIGGFQALRPYLADDFQLGARIAALGKRIVLSQSVVETAAGDPTLAEVWARHLRWSRTVRVSRPGGHLGFAVTFGTLWSLGLLATAGAPGAWLVAACLLARCAAAATVARTVGASLGAAWLLLPLADLWAVAVWAASFLGNTVVWRGRRLRLDRAGRIG